MTSSKDSITVLCSMCNKAKGIYKCEGCLRNFCPKHSIDHRSELGKQLEKIELTNDLVYQTLVQQIKDPRQHPLVKKIDQWEKESIIKVRQTAEDVRNELLKTTSQHTTQVKQKFHQLTVQLRRSREKNDFSEIDLQQWTEKLEELKRELLNPLNITIENNSIPLVSNIHIHRQEVLELFRRERGNTNESFRVRGENRYEVFRMSRRNTLDVLENAQTSVRIEENGRLIIKNALNGHAEIRGKREYTSGRHILRFKIEYLIGNGWIFFGIISKSEPIKSSSYKSPSSYGWTNKDRIYVGGINVGGSTLEMLQNDTIILIIDCDKQKIELKNERTNRSTEMAVDINRCSFPWQLHLNLCSLNTRLRILSSLN